MKKSRNFYRLTNYENIKEVLDDVFTNYPNNIAFRIKKTQNKELHYIDITYSKFQEEINALGTALINIGLQGKRIAVIGKNSYDWALGYFATVNGTGIIIPLDKGLPEQEIEALLQRSSADAIIFSSEYSLEIEKIKQAGTTSIKHFICMDKTENLEFIYLRDLIEKGKQLFNEGDTNFISAKINNNEMSILLFTSGTTSVSKAVMLSHKNVASNINSLNAMIEIYDDDVNMAFLPFHHTFGLTGILLFLNNATTNVFCDGLKYIAQNLKEYKVSVFVCVPLLLESIYKKVFKEIEKQGKTRLINIAIKISNFLYKFKIDIRRKIFKSVINNLGGKIRLVVSGASAIDKSVAKGFNDFGILTVQGYGLTETSPVLAAEDKEHIRYGSIGIPMKDVEIRIDNPNENGIGEIAARGANVMLGYYQNEEATQEAIIDGWFHTGDLGYIDKDGYIFVTGRKKNVIVMKNGKNIYPEELEILINNLPYVEESMVFGFPKADDLVVSAKIVYNKDYIYENYNNITKGELYNKIWADIKDINSNLVKYKHIKNLIITEEPLIKTTTAKIKRFEEIAKTINEEKNKKAIT